VGVALLSYVGANYIYARFYQAHLLTQFVPHPPVLSSINAQNPLLEGMPIGKLEIPRLNLSVVVLEGVEENTLRLAAGHVPQTSLPGRPGNVAIAAHRDTFFRSLRHIQNNDLIRLTTNEGVFEYVVDWTRIVKPTDVEVLAPTDKPSVTLVTCYPFRYVGSAPDRFIVRARQNSTT
jgi:sortase A